MGITVLTKAVEWVSVVLTLLSMFICSLSVSYTKFFLFKATDMAFWSNGHSLLSLRDFFFTSNTGILYTKDWLPKILNIYEIQRNHFIFALNFQMKCKLFIKRRNRQVWLMHVISVPWGLVMSFRGRCITEWDFFQYLCVCECEIIWTWDRLFDSNLKDVPSSTCNTCNISLKEC